MRRFAVVTLWICAVLAFIDGVVTLFSITSVMHQILGALYFLIFVVAIVGLALIKMLDVPPLQGEAVTAMSEWKRMHLAGKAAKAAQAAEAAQAAARARQDAPPAQATGRGYNPPQNPYSPKAPPGSA